MHATTCDGYPLPVCWHLTEFGVRIKAASAHDGDGATVDLSADDLRVLLESAETRGAEGQGNARDLHDARFDR